MKGRFALLAVILILMVVPAFGALPTLSIDDVTESEGSFWSSPYLGVGYTHFLFTVTLSAASATNVSVFYQTVAGTASDGTPPGPYPADYNKVSPHGLTFAPGETQKTIDIEVYADFRGEPDETFTVVLSGAGNADLAKDTGVGTILDDDAPPDPADIGVAMTDVDQPTHVVGETAYLTYTITNDGPADAAEVTWRVDRDSFNSTPSQGQCVHEAGGEGGDWLCRLGALASGASATIVAAVPVSTVNVCDNFPPHVTVSSSSNDDPNSGNNSIAEPLSTYFLGQPVITPASLDLAVGTSQPVTVFIGATNRYTFFLTTDNPCVSVPASVELEYRFATSPMGWYGTIPVAATSGPCTTQVHFTLREFCTDTTFSFPVSTHATAVTVSFNPPLPEVAVDQTKQVHVTVSPLSGPTSLAVLALTPNVQVPAAVAVDPASGGDLAITGLAAGTFTLSLTLPASLGGASVPLSGQVLAQPPDDPPLRVSSVTPATGTTAGGTLVRIGGNGFSTDCWAYFDGRPAHGVSFGEGSAALIAAAPPHAAGPVAVSVHCSGSADASLINAFTYVVGDDPAPFITSITPPSAAPGQTVTIHGANFRPADRLTFGPVATASLATAPDAHVVTVPSLAPGSVTVRVNDVNGPPFTVLDSSVQITHVAPAQAPAGAELTIDGSGFRSAFTFTIGGQTARLVTMSFERAVVRIPALTPGTYELAVRNGGSQVASGGSIVVTSSGLMITSAAPLCARSDGGAVVTIAGSGFNPGATVTVGGVTAPSVTVANSSHLTITLPSLPPTRATIIVRNTNGESATATNAVAVYSPLDPDGCPVSSRVRAIRP